MKILVKFLNGLGLGKDLWTSARNYQTTIAGIGAAVTAIAVALESPEPQWGLIVSALFTGWLGVRAKDGEKSSKKLGIKD